MNAYTYEVRFGSTASKEGRVTVPVIAGSVREAKVIVEDAAPARVMGTECILSVTQDGEVIARHAVVVATSTSRGVRSVGKWREIAIPAATVASRGYRVVGKYTERGSYNGHRADTCDRCGSGIKRVVVIEDRMGREYHVGTDCAGRMGLPVKGAK